mgnify:CR=1 FL=1
MKNDEESIKKINQSLKKYGIEESLDETASDMIVLNKLVEKNKKLLDMFQRYDNGESVEEIMKDSKE